MKNLSPLKDQQLFSFIFSLKTSAAFLFTLLGVMIAQIGFGQCTGLQIIGFKADNPDAIYLQAIADIPANSVFYITDNEWTGAGFNNISEQEITWTSPSTIIPSGSIIKLENTDTGSEATCGTIDGTFPIMSASGDELFLTNVFPKDDGTMTANDVCFGIKFISGGDADLTGISGVDVGDTDNGVFNGGDITDAANWTTNNNPDNITFPTASCGATALPSISIDDVTNDEGDAGTTAFTFTITLSATTAADVTFNIISNAVSATSGIDYTAVSTTGTITAGMTSTSITVNVTGETDVEADETFEITLSNVSANATISDDTGVGTITNDDVASGITVIGTCAGITAADDNKYNITITGLDATETYSLDLDGNGSFETTGVTGATSYTTTTSYDFSNGTGTQTIGVTPADGAFVITTVVHEVLCIDADSDGDLDFDSGCDEDLAAADKGYIVATVAPYTGENVYVYVLTNISNNALAANHSGLFTGLASGGNGTSDDYNVVAFNFSTAADAAAFITGLTLDPATGTTVTTATSPETCSIACGTMAYDIECFVCPTLTTLTDPADICEGSNFADLTASGFTALQMDQTSNGGPFGIEFKAFSGTTAPVDAYTDGTSLGIITNAALTNSDTEAVLSDVGSTLTAGSYQLCAILSGTPTDASCRPQACVNVVITAAPELTVPSDATACAGDSETGFSFTTDPASGVTVTWTSSVDVGFGTSGDGNIPAFTAVAGTTTVTITATSTANSDCTDEETFTVTINAFPIINTQPMDASICSTASSAAISVAASAGAAGSLSYQWQVSTDGGTSYNNVSTSNGGASAALTISGAELSDGNMFQVVISEGSSPTCSITSDAITLTVTGVACGTFPWNGN